MRLDSLRLDEILRREVAVAWTEGVSIVQAIYRELPDASNVGARFPLAAEVAISPEGRVALLRRPSGSPGVTAAGHLLGAMLQSDVPVKLRLIHSEAVAPTPAFNSLKDLSEALAYFERPDAQQLIQQLYARAAAQPARHEAAQDLADLEDFLPERPRPLAADPAVAAPHLSLATPASVQPHPQPYFAQVQDGSPAEGSGPVPYQGDRQRKNRVLAVAAIAAFVVVASGAFLTYGREQPGVTSDVENADPTSPDASPAGNAAEPRAPKAATRPPAGKSRTDAKPDSPPAVSGAPAVSPSGDAHPGAAPALSPDAIATTLTSQTTLPDPSWAASLPLIVRDPINRQLPVPAATDANGEFVYSRANREVAPPVAIRPHLPSEPPADYVSDHLMVLDLVVTSKGDVESVRLLTVPKTINDFMIVSAAKAWLFAPAKLNGRPVKYKHRIRFIVP